MSDCIVDSKILTQIFKEKQDNLMEVCFVFKNSDDIDNVLAKAEEQTGIKPVRVGFYRALKSCSVTAKPAFIRHIIINGGFSSAIASNQDEDLMIRPVGKGAK